MQSLLRRGRLDPSRSNWRSQKTPIGDRDLIEPAKKDRSLKLVKESLLNKKDQEIPSWLKLAEEQSTGQVVTLPTAQELQVPVESQLIVEYMSR